MSVMSPELSERADFMAMAGRHYENFPVGSWLVPRSLRRHIHRIYAFARTADDIADEQQDERMLQDYRDSFCAHLQPQPQTQPTVLLFQDLAATIEQFQLPQQLFLDLLDAFAQDLKVNRYDEVGLMDYCRLSADPVGRLVLRVFGQATPARDALSDQICTGLQLLNHLQDIREDLLQRDRLYFPQEDLRRFGVQETDLRASQASAEVLALVQHWAQRIAGMFRAGWPLTQMVSGRLRLELRAILWGAAHVLQEIQAQQYDVLAQHIRLRRRQKLQVLGLALLSPKMPAAFQ